MFCMVNNLIILKLFDSVMSVGIGTDPPTPPVSEEHPPQPASTQTSVREASVSTETPSVDTTSLSDTIGECVSEGQWLISRSEGEFLEEKSAIAGMFTIDSVLNILLKIV